MANTNLQIDKEEKKILQAIDAIVRLESISTKIDAVVLRVEQRLNKEPDALLVWEPVPLVIYSAKLPNMIRSSWVFVIRARVNTGPERHPNSHQRMMSYRNSGDLQIQAGEKWCSNYLLSNPDVQIENRWVSIPPNVWHQAIASGKNWAVVSFHTTSVEELIEERPDVSDTELTRQRRYL